MTLIEAEMTSDSPKYRTEKELMAITATSPTEIVAAGLRSVQYPTKVAAADNSLAMAMASKALLVLKSAEFRNEKKRTK